MTVLHIQLDRNRMMDMVTVDEIIGVQEGDLKAIRDVLARFVWSEADGAWVTPAEGATWIGQMTLRQLVDAGREFMSRAGGVAVPPPSAGA